MGVDAAPMAIIAELYVEYEGKLRSYARQLTRDSAWAEDLVQDTFTRAMLHLDLLRLLNLHQRRAWLYTTLKHRFLDEQAAHRRHETLQHTAGLNEEVFDALVLLAAGSWAPTAIAAGWEAVSELVRDMDEGRRKRLERLGFSPQDAAALSKLHTRNFM